MVNLQFQKLHLINFQLHWTVTPIEGPCWKDLETFIILNKNLLEILEIVHDYETPEDVLFQKLFVDRKD